MGLRLQPDEVADLSQEVLVQIWRRLDSYEGRGSLETWAYRFCYYQLLNSIRRGQRRGKALPLDDENEIAAEPAQKPSLEAYDLLARCMDELGDPAAEVIRQKHYEQRTFGEIGELLDLPKGTAKTLYYRGLARLRSRLRGVVRQEELE